VAQQEDAYKTVGVPAEILDPPWLDDRRDAQLETRPSIQAFVGFGFTDRLPESGITFRHRVVEDAAITYKAVHYDHGNGVIVADVDSDGLFDLYFSNQVGGNQLWRNLGGGRFEDVTEQAGVAVADRIGVSAAFGDLDNDGDPDLYITSVRQGNLLFENLGNGRFRDVTEISGLGHKGHSSGVMLFDYNRDGLLDVFLTNVGQYTSELPRIGNHEGVEYRFYDGFEDAFHGHRYPKRTERNLLFRNVGGLRFENASDTLYLADHGWSGDATMIDVNEDGWPDIYELNMQGHDQYYENQGGESFILKSRAVFPKTPWGAMGIKVFDWNNDGDMDIFITDMHSDMSRQIGPDQEKSKSDMRWDENHLMSGGNSIFGNAFFDNQGGGQFTEISDRIGAENYWPWGLSTGDLNADGFQDVLITASMNYPFRYGVNTLLINENGERFRDAEFILGIEPRRGGRTAQPWFRLDCGGNDKLSKPDCRGQDGPVEIWGALGSRSSVIFDLDEDGDLDIVTNEFNGVPQVLISNLSEQRPGRHYLSIRLVGTASNRDGIGARVQVKAGGRILTQVMDGKSGYLSFSVQPLYFGLGDAEEIEEIAVQWPSGLQQTLSAPGVLDTTLTITEPEAR
jgi:hypothetical protein